MLQVITADQKKAFRKQQALKKFQEEVEEVYKWDYNSRLWFLLETILVYTPSEVFVKDIFTHVLNCTLKPEHLEPHLPGIKYDAEKYLSFTFRFDTIMKLPSSIRNKVAKFYNVTTEIEIKDKNLNLIVDVEGFNPTEKKMFLPLFFTLSDISFCTPEQIQQVYKHLDSKINAVGLYAKLESEIYRTNLRGASYFKRTNKQIKGLHKKDLFASEFDNLSTDELYNRLNSSGKNLGLAGTDLGKYKAKILATLLERNSSITVDRVLSYFKFTAFNATRSSIKGLDEIWYDELITILFDHDPHDNVSRALHYVLQLKKKGEQSND